MICYVSRTGTRRNLEALRAANAEAGAEVWRMLVSRVGAWRDEGFRFCIDPGTWSDFKAGREFDDRAAAKFDRLLDRMGARADWVVLPDIVAGGLRSLDLSLRWSNRVLAAAPMALLAVQDGMTEEHIAPLVGPNVGVFLGGSTEWKLATMEPWGRFCYERCYYHVARVNTGKRFALAHGAGAASVDGSSATRYAKTLPLLERARRQPDLLSPGRAAA